MHRKVKGFCVRVLAGGVAGDNLITTDAGISRTPSGAVLGGAQGAGRGPNGRCVVFLGRGWILLHKETSTGMGKEMDLLRRT